VPALIAGLWLVTVSLYLGLRVLHNKKLYNLVSKAQILTARDITEHPHGMLLTDRVGNKKEEDVTYEFVCLRIHGLPSNRNTIRNTER
jgi:hypothetical protein